MRDPSLGKWHTAFKRAFATKRQLRARSGAAGVSVVTTVQFANTWGTSVEGTTASALATTQQISKRFRITDESVGVFLRRYPFLQKPILEVGDRLLDYLPGSTLYLEHFSDPEEDDQFLVLYLKACYPLEIAAGKLDVFFEEWWWQRMDTVKGKLAINLRFTDEL